MITAVTTPLDETYDTAVYDAFFGKRKKRRALRAARRAQRLQRRRLTRSPKSIKRREKRRQFFKSVGQAYQDIGGATAIGQAIDAATQQQPPVHLESPSDFDVSIGASEATRANKNEIPTVVYVLGGVVVVGIIGLALMKSQSRNTYKTIK